jgi:hypothetical protein
VRVRAPSPHCLSVTRHLAARSRSAPLPVRPPPFPTPQPPHPSFLSPFTTFSPFVQELATRSRPITGASTASAVVTHSTVTGAPSTRPPPLLPFSLGIAAPEPPLPSHPNVGPHQPPEHQPRQRTPPLSLFFRPFPSARRSGELPPSPTCPAGGPSTVDARAPHLSHGSTTAGHAVTHARSAVTALVRSHAPRAVPAGRPWTSSASGPRAPLC